MNYLYAQKFIKRPLFLAMALLALGAPALYAAEGPAAKDAAITKPAQAQLAPDRFNRGQAPKMPGPKDVVARVNGRDIVRMQLLNAVNDLIPLTVYHGSVPDDRLKKIQKRAVEGLITNELIYQLSQKEKLHKVAGREIDAGIERIKKAMPKDDTLKKALKKSGMTYEELREDIKRNIVIGKVWSTKTAELKKKSASAMTEDFLKNYYNNNKDKFKIPEQVHLRSILIKADPGGGKKVWDEALLKAVDIANAARKGEDFAGLAKKHSQDPYSSNGGDMGWAHKGSISEEIEQALPAMKTGDVSEPIQTIYGYHIVKLEERKPEVQQKYEEINKESLKKQLEKKEYKRLQEEWTAQLRDGAKIEYLEEGLEDKKKEDLKK